MEDHTENSWNVGAGDGIRTRSYTFRPFLSCVIWFVLNATGTRRFTQRWREPVAGYYGLSRRASFLAPARAVPGALGKLEEIKQLKAAAVGRAGVLGECDSRRIRFAT
jgi:hypothetical protein